MSLFTVVFIGCSEWLTSEVSEDLVTDTKADYVEYEGQLEQLDYLQWRQGREEK